jgi:hypothetical protein
MLSRMKKIGFALALLSLYFLSSCLSSSESEPEQTFDFSGDWEIIVEEGDWIQEYAFFSKELLLNYMFHIQVVENEVLGYGRFNKFSGVYDCDKNEVKSWEWWAPGTTDKDESNFEIDSDKSILSNQQLVLFVTRTHIDHLDWITLTPIDENTLSAKFENYDFSNNDIFIANKVTKGFAIPNYIPDFPTEIEPCDTRTIISNILQSKTWVYSSVNTPDNTATIGTDWQNFTVKFNASDMVTSGHTTGALAVWMSTSYTVSEDGKTVIRGDGVSMLLNPISETNFTATFTIPAGTMTQDGTLPLGGDYTFNMK